jgi:hypothetical protein
MPDWELAAGSVYAVPRRSSAMRSRGRRASTAAASPRGVAPRGRRLSCRVTILHSRVVASLTTSLARGWRHDGPMLAGVQLGFNSSRPAPRDALPRSRQLRSRRSHARRQAATRRDMAIPTFRRGEGCRLPVVCRSDTTAWLRQAFRVSIDDRVSLSAILSLPGRDRAAAGCRRGRHAR